MENKKIGGIQRWTQVEEGVRRWRRGKVRTIASPKKGLRVLRDESAGLPLAVLIGGWQSVELCQIHCILILMM